MNKLESEYTAHLLEMLQQEEKKYFFFVMKFEPNGNLEEFIKKTPNLSDSQIIMMFIDILKSFIYLKGKKIIHGDLKP